MSISPWAYGALERPRNSHETLWNSHELHCHAGSTTTDQLEHNFMHPKKMGHVPSIRRLHRSFGDWLFHSQGLWRMTKDAEWECVIYAERDLGDVEPRNKLLHKWQHASAVCNVTKETNNWTHMEHHRTLQTTPSIGQGKCEEIPTQQINDWLSISLRADSCHRRM